MRRLNILRPRQIRNCPGQLHASRAVVGRPGAQLHLLHTCTCAASPTGRLRTAGVAAFIRVRSLSSGYWCWFCQWGRLRSVRISEAPCGFRPAPSRKGRLRTIGVSLEGGVFEAFPLEGAGSLDPLADPVPFGYWRWARRPKGLVAEFFERHAGHVDALRVSTRRGVQQRAGDLFACG